MSENNHPINDLMGTTMDKIRELVDANTIIGQPITTGDTTLIPVSRMSVGFVSGGSDFIPKNHKSGDTNTFGGGGGAGVTVSPVAFLIVKGENVRILTVDPPAGNTIDRIVELVPEVMDRVRELFKKDEPGRGGPGFG